MSTLDDLKVVRDHAGRMVVCSYNDSIRTMRWLHARLEHRCFVKNIDAINVRWICAMTIHAHEKGDMRWKSYLRRLRKYTFFVNMMLKENPTAHIIIPN